MSGLMTSRRKVWFEGLRFPQNFFLHIGWPALPPHAHPRHARTLGKNCAGGEGTLQGKLSHAGPCFQLTWTAALSLLLHCPPASPSRPQHWLRGEGKEGVSGGGGQGKRKLSRGRVVRVGEQRASLHPPSFWMMQRTILSTVSSFMSSSSAEG